MNKLIFLLVSFTAVSYGSESLNLNKPSSPTGRIVGGEPASVSSAPYIASVQLHQQHRCGGAILSPSLVLTSARCVVFIPIANLQVRAGSTYWYIYGVVVAVANVRIHERYNQETLENDIAILRLRYNLPLSNSLLPINLAQSTPVDGAYAVTAGWGILTPTSNTISPNLNYGIVSVIGNRNCSSSRYGYGAAVKPTTICAVGPGRAACDGDYGGPLVSNSVLVGIASWAYGCANPTYPTIYTNIAVLRQWIENAAQLV